MTTNNKSKRKPQWFSTAVALATNNSPTIDCDPFPSKVRNAIESHIRKATENRDAALTSIREQMDPVEFDEVLSSFRSNPMSKEGEFEFDIQLHPLRDSLLKAFQLENNYDLTLMHQDTFAKNNAFHSLTTHPGNRIQFQEVFDTFVRAVCAPHLVNLMKDNKSTNSPNLTESLSSLNLPCTEIYYQAFPCIRVVQPNDFSIGPHADVMYGHHPCSINYYLPLTHIGGTSALFLESAPNEEDWHPIVGNYGTCVKHFAGGSNLHFTVENQTGRTRVSLDFRLIPGHLFDTVDCNDSQFVKKHGYYSKCKLTTDGTWERVGGLLEPDGRVGFPWTVKDWSKLLKKVE